MAKEEVDIMKKDTGEILADYFSDELSDAEFCQFIRDAAKFKKALDEALETLEEVLINTSELAAHDGYFKYIANRSEKARKLYWEAESREITWRNLRENKELVTVIRATISKQDAKP